MRVEIDCPRCGDPLEAELYKDAYCPKCHTTFKAETEVFDMYTGQMSYALTGESYYGEPSH